MENRKLKDLIIDAEQFDEFQWLNSIDLSTAKDLTPANRELLPRDHVLRIYSTRSKINTDRGKPINGFDYLLGKLSTAALEKVSIHSLLKAGYEYWVFTDPDVDQLLGILGPLRTNKQF